MNLINVNVNKIYNFVILNLLLIITTVNLATLWNYKYYETDFLVFFSATKLLINNTDKLYDKDVQSEEEYKVLQQDKIKAPRLYGPFVNVPLTLIPFIPVISLNPQLALKIVGGLFFVISGFLIILLNKLFAPNHRMNLKDFLFNLNFTPLFIMVAATQSTLIYMCFLIGILTLLKEYKYKLAGLLAPFLWVSPQIAVLPTVWLLISWNKKIIKWYLLGSMIFLAINGLLIHMQWIPFYNLLTWYSSYYEKFVQNTATMVSIQGFLAQFSKIILPMQPYTVALYLSLIVILICLGYFIRAAKFNDPFSTLPIAIVGTLLSGMHIHWHSATLLLFIYWYYYSYRKTRVFRVIAICGWLIFTLAFYSPFYPNPFYFAPTLYLFLLFVVGIKKLYSSTSES